MTNPFKWKDDEEQDSFVICFEDAQGDHQYIDHEFTLHEVIAFLNALEWSFDINGEETVSGLDFFRDNAHDWEVYRLALQLEQANDVTIGLNYIVRAD